MGYEHIGFGPDALGLAGFMGSFFILALIWTLIWKGLALWRASKRGDMWWFIILLVVNTLGILEIIYLFGVAGAKFDDLLKGKNH
jgi:methionyl-tRNA synthetase